MPKIGKNVLENLTRGMYEDALIIYREYIQNAADQIDKALANETFSDEMLEIVITIDKSNRRIVIADNANGISSTEIERRLADVADSEKIQGEDKGFRGIGRLGGLAYCRELRFITSYFGETEQTTMIWDAALLEQMLNDRSVRDSAENILERIISYEREECDANEHFFRVELIDVKPSNNNLLDIANVRQYISEVAPLEYSERFSTCFPKLEMFLVKQQDSKSQSSAKKKDFILHQYNVIVDGEPCYRPYSTYIYQQPPKNSTNVRSEPIDEIKDVHADLITTDSGKVVAWIWFGLSCFKESLYNKKYNGLVGLRLRQFNIEIGGRRTLDKFFRETRGNSYFIGEVHALADDLIPNARRDYFVENDALREFEDALKNYIERHLEKLYRTGSELNSNYNRITKYDELKAKYNQKQSSGFTSKSEEERLRREVEVAEQNASAAEKKIQRIVKQANQSVGSPLEKMVALVQSERGQSEPKQTNIKAGSASEMPAKKKPRPKLLVDELSNLKKDERKLVSQIYEIIRANMPGEVGEALIQNIHAELRASIK